MASDPTKREGLRDRLRNRRGDLIAAAARRGASNLRVFGSVARGDDGLQSDIDFLVDFEASRSLVDVAGLILDLQDILQVRASMPGLPWKEIIGWSTMPTTDSTMGACGTRCTTTFPDSGRRSSAIAAEPDWTG